MPFCKERTIKVMHKEQTFSTKRTRIRSEHATKLIKEHEKNDIFSEKCPNCGKSKKEIEKALKQGKQPSREEILRRMKEAGLPLRI